MCPNRSRRDRLREVANGPETSPPPTKPAALFPNVFKPFHSTDKLTSKYHTTAPNNVLVVVLHADDAPIERWHPPLPGQSALVSSKPAVLVPPLPRAPTWGTRWQDKHAAPGPAAKIYLYSNMPPVGAQLYTSRSDAYYIHPSHEHEHVRASCFPPPQVMVLAPGGPNGCKAQPLHPLPPPPPPLLHLRTRVYGTGSAIDECCSCTAVNERISQTTIVRTEANKKQTTSFLLAPDISVHPFVPAPPQPATLQAHETHRVGSRTYHNRAQARRMLYPARQNGRNLIWEKFREI